MKNILQENLEKLDREYFAQDSYLKYGALLGLWRFLCFAKLSPLEMLEKFKTKVIAIIEEEEGFLKTLQAIKYDIKTLEHEAQRLADRAMYLNRKLLDLQIQEQNHVSFPPQNKIVKEISIIQFEIEEINKDKTKCQIEIKHFFKQQLEIECALKRLYKRVEIEKQSALSSSLSKLSVAIITTNQDWHELIKHLKILTSSSNKADINKLFHDALATVYELPIMGLPNSYDNDGLKYSDDARYYLIKSFVVVKSAYNLANKMSVLESENYYLLALKEYFAKAMSVIHDKIRYDTKNIDEINFNLLTKSQQNKYLAKRICINSNLPNEIATLRKFDFKIGEEVRLIKYKSAKGKLDKLLLSANEIGKKIKAPQNSILYNGLLIYFAGIDELKFICNEVEKKLASNSLLHEASAKSLQQFNMLKLEIFKLPIIDEQEFFSMQQYMDTPATQQDFVYLLMQEILCYISAVAFSVDENLLSYNLGEFAFETREILNYILCADSKEDQLKPNNIIAKLGAAIFGLNPLELSAKYSDANVAKILTKEDFIAVKKADALFTQEVNIFTEKSDLQIASICNDLEKFKQANQSGSIGFARACTISSIFIMACIGTCFAFTNYSIFDKVDFLNHLLMVAVFAVIVVCNVSLYVNNRFSNLSLEKLYNFALTNIQRAEHNLQINFPKLDCINKNLNLTALIAMLNAHFNDQSKLIQDRIIKLDLKQAIINKQEVKFVEKLLREIHCFRDMLSLKTEIGRLLIEINLIKITNLKMAHKLQLELKKLLTEYLAIHYASYQKPHMIDALVDSYSTSSNSAPDASGVFSPKKLISIFVKYHNKIFNKEDNYSQNTGNLFLYLEQQKLENMQKIKQLLQEII